MGARRASLILVLAVALGACRRGASGGAAPETAPNFALKDLGGKTVRLSDFQGKVVLLDFWATYCDPCQESIPVFEKLYEEYRPRGVEIVGVSMDPASDVVPGFVKEHKMRYTIVLDPENGSQEAFGVRAIPTTLLLDRRGKVRRRWMGFDAEVAAEVRSGVEEALREPST